MPKYYFRSYSTRGHYEKVISASSPLEGLAIALQKSTKEEFANLGQVIAWNETGFESNCLAQCFEETAVVLYELGYYD